MQMQRSPTSDHGGTGQNYPKDEDHEDEGQKGVRVLLHPHHLLMLALSLRAAVIWMTSEISHPEWVTEINVRTDLATGGWVKCLMQLQESGWVLLSGSTTSLSCCCCFSGLVLLTGLDFWMQNAAPAPSIPLEQREGTDGVRHTHSPHAIPSLLFPLSRHFTLFLWKWRWRFLPSHPPSSFFFLFLAHCIGSPFVFSSVQCRCFQYPSFPVPDDTCIKSINSYS